MSGNRCGSSLRTLPLKNSSPPPLSAVSLGELPAFSLFGRLVLTDAVLSDITDMITPDEALNMLKEKEAGKAERIAKLKQEGYPAYTTSVGWYVATNLR